MNVGDTSPNLPTKVGVIGGGRMGAGIAHAFVISGVDVVVVERDAGSAAAAWDRIAAGISVSVARKVVVATERDLLRQVRVSTDYVDLADRDLVIEAVPEVWEFKRAALEAIEAVIPTNSYMATNTSSMSIDQLANLLSGPERFLGLHFFNPVPASSLVEIVVGERTDAPLVRTAELWVQALGKSPIVVRDSPGFASSRLGVMLALEAMRMLEEGVASAADIDTAMVLGYRHPTGPLHTTDLVGLDVRLDIANYLHSTLGERFAPPRVLRDKVANGELGRKTGEGFFSWNDAPPA